MTLAPNPHQRAADEAVLRPASLFAGAAHCVARTEAAPCWSRCWSSRSICCRAASASRMRCCLWCCVGPGCLTLTWRSGRRWRGFRRGLNSGRPWWRRWRRKRRKSLDHSRAGSLPQEVVQAKIPCGSEPAREGVRSNNADQPAETQSPAVTLLATSPGTHACHTCG